MPTTLVRIQLLSKTGAEFASANPVLLDGELGVADTGSTRPVVKIGDGVRLWAALPELTPWALLNLDAHVAGDWAFDATQFFGFTPAEVVDLKSAPGVLWQNDGTDALHAEGRVAIDARNATPELALQRAAGTSYGTLTPIQSGGELGRLSFRGSNGAASSARGANIAALAKDNWSAGSSPAYISVSCAPAGSTTEQQVATFGAEPNFNELSINGLPGRGASLRIWQPGVSLWQLMSSGGSANLTWVTGQTTTCLTLTPAGALTAISNVRSQTWLQGDTGVGNATLGNALTWNAATYPYGSASLKGARNAFVGLVLESATAATFMANSSTNVCGVYLQTPARWAWHDDGTAFNVALPITSNGTPVSLLGHTHSGADITSGTVADARLSANVVLTTDPRLSVFGAAKSGIAPSSGGGTANYLRADGTWAAPPGFGGAAPDNPITKVGLVAVNGSAATFMRSDAAPALDVAIAPTWIGVHTFGAAVNVNGGSFQISNATPLFVFTESDAPTDAKQWRLRGVSGSLIWGTATDVGATGGNFLQVGRTGTKVDSVQLGNATDNPIYTFLGTGAGTSANPWTWTGSQAWRGGLLNTATNTQVAAGVSASNVPVVLLTCMGAPANKRAVAWYIDTAGSSLLEYTNDAGGGNVTIMRVSQGTTGPSVATVQFPTMPASFSPPAVLIGTLGAFNVGYLATVRSASASVASFLVAITDAATQAMSVHHEATSGNNVFTQFYTEAAGTIRGNIDFNRAGGQVRYNTTSDAVLKTNIADASDAGALIDAIRVRQFDWLENGRHLDHWVVAQELFAVFPHAVREGNGIAGDASEFWGVDVSKLVPLMIKEIQSLRSRLARIERLQ